MVKISVLYPCQEGGTFDMAYYREKHLPLVRTLLGPALKRLTVDEGLTVGEHASPYIVICDIWFDSVEEMQAALNANMVALGADVPRYTNLQPVFQFSRLAVA